MGVSVVLPYFGWSFAFSVPFLCLVEIAGLHCVVSLVQPSSWCSAIILACFQYALLCLRICGLIPFAVIKSSALWVARTMQSTMSLVHLLLHVCNKAEGGVAVNVVAVFLLIVAVLACSPQSCPPLVLCQGHGFVVGVVVGGALGGITFCDFSFRLQHNPQHNCFLCHRPSS